MIYFLFDNPEDKKRLSFLKNGLDDETVLLFPQRKCISYIDQIRECKKTIRQSTSEDIIICWYDFMAVLCWWLCKLTCQKRNILALNLLLKDKSSMKNRVAKKLYKRAIMAKNFQATVTSTEYGIWINELLKTNADFHLVHDLFQKDYEIEDTKKQKKRKTIFCGGRNGRDWDFLFNLTRKLPDIDFDVVVPRDIYQRYISFASTNVSMLTNISSEDFITRMCSSSAVILPLDTEAPAGLIVLFQAGANKVPVIISDTVTTRGYINNERGYLCGKKYEEWENAIYSILINEQEANKKSNELYHYLELFCNENVYIKSINDSIQIFKEK